MKNTKKHIRYITEAGLVAALYVVLTQLSAIVGLGNGPIQLRISEMLCVLAIYTPSAVPGISLGCLVSNLWIGSEPWDIVFGTLASVVGMLGCRLLRKRPYVAPIAYTAANILIVPQILKIVYNAEEALWLLYVTVGVGEILSAYVLGIFLYRALRPHSRFIFGAE